ncbi:hypothetical protein D9758_000895 [Tetrapyrgos nigripes]|uniref:Heat shock 70 kDa protein 12A n=1 Tax=Tetrapyrgos nigripes TaxID=182062 RepID=A0A8H5GZA5_9AGAR|nr:hypothetical protein D9758_000895 [Tetrapyrgos nigripes]
MELPSSLVLSKSFQLFPTRIMKARKPYNGTDRKLIIAFDVGTTYSGCSLLEPGMVPEIKGVTRFPARHHTSGDAKIPTILWYDHEGKVRAAGAEANDEYIVDLAEQRQWILCKLFKLHVKHPDNSVTRGDSNMNQAIAPLPPGKTVVDVYSDFLFYLMSCTSKFIKEAMPGGEVVWARIQNSIEFVLTHPNGWGGLEQQQLREAAVAANLIQDTGDDHNRIHFVAEGEASLHFCIMSGLNMPKAGVIIADAGGGTVDLSSYSRVQGRTRYEELVAPVCKPLSSPVPPSYSFLSIKALHCGSVYVTFQASRYFEEKLGRTRFKDDIPRATSAFDTGAKLVFKSRESPSFVMFGGLRDTDASLDIKSGQMKIPGTVVANFFSPSINDIHVFLVGGFAASEWLFSELHRFLNPLGFAILRPDRYVSKAVADGAISYYLDHVVAARISKKVIGADCIRDYIPDDPEHQKRASEIQLSCTGKQELHYGFDIILHKGERVVESQEFRRPYYLERKTLAELHSVSADIMVYNGDIQNPQWLDEDPDNFIMQCTVYADTTLACQGLLARTTKRKRYYRLDYEIVLSLGLTEMKAQLIGLCYCNFRALKRGILFDDRSGEVY